MEPGATALLSALESLRAEIIGCRRCPRLVAFREEAGRAKKPQFRDWDYWAKPVPGFGDPYARLLIVGLAPAAHGGNRTGRVFTGDASARFLMSCLHEAGFASQPTSEHAGDGLRLIDAYMAAAGRCTPPGDRPTRQELANCLPFLQREVALLPRVQVALALGRVGFEACLDAFGVPHGAVRPRFQHGAWSGLGAGRPRLVASYHPSPRNTNTGVLTRGELVRLLLDVRGSLTLRGIP